MTRSFSKSADSFYCSIVALTLGGIYAALRTGFEPHPVARVVSLSFFLLFSPPLFKALWRTKKWDDSAPWYFSDSALLVGALCLLLALAFFSDRLAIRFWIPLGLIGT